MAEQGSPSDQGNTEYILGSLNDETPSSSSSEENDGKDINSDHIQNPPKKPCQIVTKICSRNLEKDPMKRIMAIRSETEKIKEEFLSLEKAQLKSDYKKYEEVLILKTLSLDKIDISGDEEHLRLKELRKDAIVYVQDCLTLLDIKVKESS